MLEAEYSEVCDEIDGLKRIGLDYDKEIKVLESQKQAQIREFNKKYGRNPRYIIPNQRYYGQMPIK